MAVEREEGWEGDQALLELVAAPAAVLALATATSPPVIAIHVAAPLASAASRSTAISGAGDRTVVVEAAPVGGLLRQRSVAGEVWLMRVGGEAERGEARGEVVAGRGGPPPASSDRGLVPAVAARCSSPQLAGSNRRSSLIPPAAAARLRPVPLAAWLRPSQLVLCRAPPFFVAPTAVSVRRRSSRWLGLQRLYF